MELYLLQIERHQDRPKPRTWFETIPLVFANMLAAERYSIYLKERFKHRVDLKFDFKKTSVITPPDVYKMFEDVRKSKLTPQPQLWEYGVERDKEYY